MEKPSFVEALEGHDPELLKHMSSLQEFAGKDGALSARIKTLISMLGDAVRLQTNETDLTSGMYTLAAGSNLD